jgi:hypothetical protein
MSGVGRASGVARMRTSVLPQPETLARLERPSLLT